MKHCNHQIRNIDPLTEHPNSNDPVKFSILKCADRLCILFGRPVRMNRLNIKPMAAVDIFQTLSSRDFITPY